MRPDHRTGDLSPGRCLRRHAGDHPSPGPLPDALSFEDLGTGRSEIRNRILAPIFKDMKLIEAWGSGIQKMKTKLKKYPEIELVLQEAGHAFQVQFVKKEMAGDEAGTKQALTGTK